MIITSVSGARGLILRANLSGCIHEFLPFSASQESICSSSTPATTCTTTETHSLQPFSRESRASMARAGAVEDMKQPFPTMVQRTCSMYACCATRQYVFLHRNGVAIMGLAPGHPALSGSSDAALSVAFEAGIKVQRKRKRGKQSGAVQGTETLCTVKRGSSSFPITATINSYVLELNTMLEGAPEVLERSVRPRHPAAEIGWPLTAPCRSQPDCEGFLAILAPTEGKIESQDVSAPGGAATSGTTLVPMDQYMSALTAGQLPALSG